jgi:hypothetical protein
MFTISDIDKYNLFSREEICRKYVTRIFNPEGRTEIETQVLHKVLISDFTKM